MYSIYISIDPNIKGFIWLIKAVSNTYNCLYSKRENKWIITGGYGNEFPDCPYPIPQSSGFPSGIGYAVSTGHTRGLKLKSFFICFFGDKTYTPGTQVWAEAVWDAYLKTEALRPEELVVTEEDKKAFKKWNEDGHISLDTVGKCILYQNYQLGIYDHYSGAKSYKALCESF